MAECPVCKSEAHLYNSSPGQRRFDCQRCGEFDLTDSLIAELPSKLDLGVHRRALMSHHLRRMERAKTKPFLITTYDVERLWLGERLPSPLTQADDLLLWIGDNQLSPDEPIRCALLYLGAWVGASLNPN